MNIFRHELGAKMRSVLVWGLGVSFLILAFTYIGSTMAEDTALLDEMMSAFPDELLVSFGMDNLDLSSPLGFFAMSFTMVQVSLAIQAANFGFGLVSVEEHDMTADFLLAKPVGRRSILTSKYLAAFLALTLTNVIVWVSSFTFVFMFRNGQEVDSGSLIWVLSSTALFQLVFLGLGTAISLLVRKVRSVTPYAMGLAFGLYIFNAFGDMMGDSLLEDLTPFKHFEPNFIITNQQFDLPLAYISIFYILASIAASYFLYERRNIPSVT